MKNSKKQLVKNSKKQTKTTQKFKKLTLKDLKHYKGGSNFVKTYQL